MYFTIYDLVITIYIYILLQVITSLLELILKLNNFTFNDKFYLQTMGCAMGTKCAPAYANLFMGQFEEKLLLPIIGHLSKMYLRFIDDIFILWSGSEDQLKEFISLINSLHPSIKSDFKRAFYFEIRDLDHIEFLTVLRLCLGPLRAHKFGHGF